MIPAEIVEFVHGPQIILIGTRDGALRPTSARVVGLIAEAEDDLITVMVAEAVGARTFANLADNGRAAIVVSEFPSHRTYQFKGVCAGISPCAAKHKAVRDLYLEKLGVRFREHLWAQPPADFLDRYIVDPARAVSIRVEAMFDQTPGPRAGAAFHFKSGR